MTAAAHGEALLRLAHALGESRFAILGEGNVSTDCGDGTFWVKASGSSLEHLSAADLCRVQADVALALLDGPDPSEADLAAALEAARLGPGKPPSVETFLHAVCIKEGGARVVGHTHPTAVNRILCSRLGADPFLRHVFPDAVVVCGLHPLVLPYCDPGMALARAARAELRRYRAKHGCVPKLLLLENHGLVALGQSAREVLNIHLMADKWADVLWGSYALGGPRFLEDADAVHIDARRDEAHRRLELLREPHG